MGAKRPLTPLDKEALVLLPGLRSAQALIDIAKQTCWHSALRPSIQKTRSMPKKPA